MRDSVANLQTAYITCWQSTVESHYASPYFSSQTCQLNIFGQGVFPWCKLACWHIVKNRKTGTAYTD